MPIDIRPAEAADADLISVLNREVQSKHAAALPWLFKDTDLAREAAEALLRSERNLVLIASVDGQPAGYIYAEFRDFRESPLTFPYEALHIHHISVARAFRRTGIGRALMDHVIVAAKERDVRRMTADYWAFNEQAQAFFEGFGLMPYNIRVWRELGER
jgi:ribosomal protein S18 acetylase RimI-like enzyme